MHICLVVSPGFPLLVPVLLREVLNATNTRLGRPEFSCHVRSVTESAVRAGDGTRVEPDATGWSHLSGFDLVLVAAGGDPMAHVPMGLRAFLNRAAAAGSVLGGIGTGAILLAKLGHLTGHMAALPDWHEDFPDVAPSPQPFVLDRDRLTAGGGMGTLSALLAWIAQRHGPELASDVSDILEYGTFRAIGAAYKTCDIKDPILAQMQTVMASHMSPPLSLPHVAQQLGLSPKQLRRRCQQALGLTPAQIYLRLRLERAREMVDNTALSVAEISNAIGFASASAFSRSYKAAFGTPPRRPRQAQTG